MLPSRADRVCGVCGERGHWEVACPALDDIHKAYLLARAGEMRQERYSVGVLGEGGADSAAAAVVVDQDWACSLCRASWPGRRVKCACCEETFHQACVLVHGPQRSGEWTCDVCAHEPDVDDLVETLDGYVIDQRGKRAPAHTWAFKEVRVEWRFSLLRITSPPSPAANTLRPAHARHRQGRHSALLRGERVRGAKRRCCC